MEPLNRTCRRPLCLDHGARLSDISCVGALRSADLNRRMPQRWHDGRDQRTSQEACRPFSASCDGESRTKGLTYS